MTDSDSDKDQPDLSKEEADRRRDEVLRRMLNTPPKPHKPSQKRKKGKTPDK